jgi:hypothetical protein
MADRNHVTDAITYCITDTGLLVCRPTTEYRKSFDLRLKLALTSRAEL